MLIVNGKRVRGYCEDCGGYVYTRTARLCWECFKNKKAAVAHNNTEQVEENKRKSRLNWYYKNKERSQATSRAWKENNRERIELYNLEHVNERRGYTEARRARLLEAGNEVSGSVWAMLLRLYKNECAYCLQRFDSLEQDHVIPLSKGGKHTMDNVVPACLSCNRSKATNIGEPKHRMWKVMRLTFGN